MNTGALQSFAVRQLITPEPYSPPTTNAAFFIDGMTATHCALLHSSSGMALSGEFGSSLRIVPASLRRLTSSFDGAANVELAIMERTQVTTTRFMLASAPSCVQGERLVERITSVNAELFSRTARSTGEVVDSLPTPFAPGAATSRLKTRAAGMIGSRHASGERSG